MAYFRRKKHQNRLKNAQNPLKNDRKTSKKQQIQPVFTLFIARFSPIQILRSAQNDKKYY